MKKVILTIVTIATLFSCTIEEMAQSETQDLSFNRMPIFVGEYLNSETYINGELSDTCDTTWSFTATSVFVKRVESCDESAQGRILPYTFDDATLYIGQPTDTGVVQIEYPYTEASNGDLTLTLLTGSYELVYKLTR